MLVVDECSLAPEPILRFFLLFWLFVLELDEADEAVDHRLVFPVLISCSRVQIPSGPRKSLIPLDVEMPAPVNTTRWFDDWTNSTSLLIFSLSDRAESNDSGNPTTPLLGYADNRSAYPADILGLVPDGKFFVSFLPSVGLWWFVGVCCCVQMAPKLHRVRVISSPAATQRRSTLR